MGRGIEIAAPGAEYNAGLEVADDQLTSEKEKQARLAINEANLGNLLEAHYGKVAQAAETGSRLGTESLVGTFKDYVSQDPEIAGSVMAGLEEKIAVAPAEEKSQLLSLEKGFQKAVKNIEYQKSLDESFRELKSLADSGNEISGEVGGQLLEDTVRWFNFDRASAENYLQSRPDIFAMLAANYSRDAFWGPVIQDMSESVYGKELIIDSSNLVQAAFEGDEIGAGRRTESEGLDNEVMSLVQELRQAKAAPWKGIDEQAARNQIFKLLTQWQGADPKSLNEFLELRGSEPDDPAILALFSRFKTSA